MQKKVLLVSVLCMSLFMFGCGKSNKTKAEADLEKYAVNYYETYIKGHVEGLDVPEITIENLENAIQNGGAKYDMKNLKGCNVDSYARLILKANKKDVDHVEIKLTCK